MSIYYKSYHSNKFYKKQIVTDLLNYITFNFDVKNLTDNELTLVLDEVITNSMEHGNLWDPLKKINIKINLKNEHLYLVIEDEGNGFNKNQNLKKPDISEPRGRGILLIGHYCLYEFNDSGNQIKLKFEINK